MDEIGRERVKGAARGNVARAPVENALIEEEVSRSFCEEREDLLEREDVVPQALARGEEAVLDPQLDEEGEGLDETELR